MNGLDYPVNARIPTNGFVLGVNKNDFKVFVRGILIYPVRIQDPEIGAATAHTFFGSGFERALVFELIHTLIGGLACK